MVSHLPHVRTQFTLFANTINDSFQFRVKAIFAANRGLSREVTTSAKEVNTLFFFLDMSFTSFRD